LPERSLHGLAVLHLCIRVFLTLITDRNLDLGIRCTSFWSQT